MNKNKHFQVNYFDEPNQPFSINADEQVVDVQALMSYVEARRTAERVELVKGIGLTVLDATAAYMQHAGHVMGGLLLELGREAVDDFGRSV
jgi:hypothetical protein